jgi:hypothetical protein
MKSKIIYIIVVFFLISCKEGKKNSNKITLYYDMYVEDRLIQKYAVIVEYSNSSNDSSRVVSIKSDTTQIQYFEKVSDVGIFRSFDNRSFSLTHPFALNGKLESDLGKQYPIFINNWVTKVAEKKYSLGKETVSVYFFDETLSNYSVTASFYLKDYNTFVLYYLPSKYTYFKLSKIEGMDSINEKTLLEISDRVLSDSLFTAYYKPPRIEAPSLK